MKEPDQKPGGGAQEAKVNHTGLTDEELREKYDLEPGQVPERVDLTEQSVTESQGRNASPNSEEIKIFPT